MERTYRGGGRRGGGARGHHGGVEFGGWTREREAGAARQWQLARRPPPPPSSQPAACVERGMRVAREGSSRIKRESEGARAVEPARVWALRVPVFRVCRARGRGRGGACGVAAWWLAVAHRGLYTVGIDGAVPSFLADGMMIVH